MVFPGRFWCSAALAAFFFGAQALWAQPLITNYDLIPSDWKSAGTQQPSLLEKPELPKYTEAVPQASVPSSFGLSISPHWSARVGVTGGDKPELMSVGGSYSLQEGQQLSLQLARGNRENLGLALRYERPAYYLGLGYEGRPRSTSPWDSLLFSGGLRF